MRSSPDADVHDRTHRLAKLLGIGPEAVRDLADRRVVLEIGPEAAAMEIGKLAFLTLCNLVTRLGPYVPHLEVCVPPGAMALDSPVYRAGGSSLGAQALWILRAAIPVEDLIRQAAHVHPTLPYDVAVSIGTSAVSARVRLRVGWEGWLAMVGDEEEVAPSVADANPFGAMTASAMATARLHGLQLTSVGAKIPLPTETWRLNALTLTAEGGGAPLPGTEIRVPRLLLVGAGALGSSFTYAMAHVRGVLAEVDAIDPDVLKPSNANRQITAPFERAEDEHTHKVDDLAACWAAVRPIPLTYDEFKAEHGRSAGDYEIAISAVDNAQARREMARDLPRVAIDGATGGLMVTLMRGADPALSCVACAYAEIITDEDAVWSRRLGTSRERVCQLRDGNLAFTDEVLSQIRDEGTLVMDAEIEDGLRTDGWAYLSRARCGHAKPDRDLPSASVSYVSSLCGFLMASQVIGETLGVPTLIGRPSWVWSDLLRESPLAAERLVGDTSRDCLARHDRRSRIYRSKWP